MDKKGLTLSILFEAESANYGEGFGNITVLKKLGRGDRKQYTYISRQALRYNMMQQLGWDNTPVLASGSGDKKVVQFAPEATIEQYPEIDLFGYLKTTAKTEDKKGGSSKRAAVARLSNAIALEAYQGDMDYLTNMGLATRIKDVDNSIAQSEIHKSIYVYTVTVDLDCVGIDENDKIDLPAKDKAQRVKDFLDTIQFLYRDIKGRRENLNPLFAIGGVYGRKNPYFENRLRLQTGKLEVGLIKNIIDSSTDVSENTVVGYLDGILGNDQEIKTELKPLKVAAMFNQLKAAVDGCYE